MRYKKQYLIYNEDKYINKLFNIFEIEKYLTISSERRFMLNAINKSTSKLIKI